MSHWKEEEARHARVAKFGQQIALHLDAIQAMHKGEVKLTLIIRDPDFPDGSRNTYQSNDEWPKAKAAVEKLFSEPDNEMYTTRDGEIRLAKKP